MVQLLHPHMTTGKTIALTRQTFVSKVISLLLNMLSRLVITFLPRSKRLWISWLQSPYVVILEPKKIKSVTVSIVSPPNCHEVMGPDAMILVFWMLSFKTWSLESLETHYFSAWTEYHSQIYRDAEDSPLAGGSWQGVLGGDLSLAGSLGGTQQW